MNQAEQVAETGDASGSLDQTITGETSINKTAITDHSYTMQELQIPNQKNPLSQLRQDPARANGIPFASQKLGQAPETEFQQFENPCLAFIHDYKSILDDLGIQFSGIKTIASGYD